MRNTIQSPLSIIRKQKKLLNIVTFLFSYLIVHAQEMQQSNTESPQIVWTNFSQYPHSAFSTIFKNGKGEKALPQLISKQEDRLSEKEISAIIGKKNLKAEKIGVGAAKKEDAAKDEKDAHVIPANEKQGIIGKSESLAIDELNDNIFTIHLKEEPKKDKTIYLEYELFGLADASSVTKSINEGLARGGYVIKTNKQWTQQRERININELKKGDNYINFTTWESADYQYMVRNVKLIYEEEKASKPIIFNQENVQSYNGKIYVSGFVEDKNIKEIHVLDKSFPVTHGNFEAIFEQKILEAYVKMTYKTSNGKVITDSVSVVQSLEKPSQIHSWAEKGITISKQFNKTSTHSQELQLSGARLYIEGGSLSKNQTFSINGLRYVDLPTLSPEMVNVTDGYSGYRMLPSGEHFTKKPAKIKLTYDESKIPAGYTAKDIKTFYFDNSQKKWMALEKDTLLYDTKEIVSKTTHFTDFINGIIKVPESPETGSYTPTSIKDIKAADPTTGVVSIAPPSPNNMGTVNTSFPIKLPAGRAGMQPSLSVNYSSEGGNGWMGLGWNLSIPGISLDTRWGAPRYDTAIETEIYSMGGGMLVLKDGEDYTNPHRKDAITRQADRLFYPRIEGSYAQVIRHGDSPINYWWEVTDKMGNKSFYGNYNDSPNAKTAEIKTETGNVAYWGLAKTLDTHGNYVEYIYYNQPAILSNEPGDGGNEFYIKEIRYTLHPNEQKNYYKVSFNRNSYSTVTPVTPTYTPRRDIQIYGKNGLIQVTKDLLTEIKVEFINTQNISPTIRSYQFEYNEHAFFKQQLIKISEYDTNGELFYTNTMEYEDEVTSSISSSGDRIYDLFETKKLWNTRKDELANISALGGAKSKNSGFGFAFTFGPNDGVLGQKSLSFGPNIGNNRGTSNGISTLMDLNGDGLPDKILNKGALEFRSNQSGPLGVPNFSNVQNTFNAPTSNFMFQRNSSTTVGTELTVGYGLASANIGTAIKSSKTRTSTYLSDVNGDGLMDLVNDKKVHFGFINPNGDIEFSPSSDATPNQIIGGVAVGNNIITPPENEETTLRKQNPLLDVVKVWKAPYKGTVNINATATLSANSTDGARVMLQHQNKELSRNTLNAEEATTFNLTQRVSEGEYIYFRVSSIDNGENDEVTWAGNITYTTPPHTFTGSDGLSYNTFSISENSIYPSSGVSAVQPSAKNVPLHAKVTGTIDKPLLTDNIEIIVQHTQNGSVINEQSLLDGIKFDTQSNIDLDKTTKTIKNITAPTDQQQSDEIRLIVRANSNVDWKKLRFNDIKVKFFNPNKADEAISLNLNPEIQFYNWEKQGNNITGFPLAPTVIKTAGSYTLTPSLTFSLDNIPPSGIYNWVVKRMNAAGTIQEIKYKKIEVNNGVITPPITSITFDAVTANDIMYSEFYTTNANLIAATVSSNTIFTGITPAVPDTNTASNIFLLDRNDLFNQASSTDINTQTDGRFGSMYRNWGQFAYNGGSGNFNDPNNDSAIDPDILTITVPKNPGDPLDPPTPIFNQRWFMMNPFIGEFFDDNDNAIKVSRWQGPDNNVWVNGNILSASRLGEDNITEAASSGFDAATPDSFGAIAVDKISRSSDTSNSLGISLGIGLSGSESKGQTEVKSEFIDLNGDKYPDIIGSKNIHFTNSLGGLANPTLLTQTATIGSNMNFIIDHDAKGLSAGVNVSTSTPTALKAMFSKSKTQETSGTNADDSAKKSTLSASINIGASLLNDNNDRQAYTLGDINGDGLPDKLRSDEGNVFVQYNLGYGFTEEIVMPVVTETRKGHSETQNNSVGVGIASAFTIGNGSVSGGISNTKMTVKQITDLVDVNGDGLVDKILENGSVILNLGNTFSDRIAFNNPNYFSDGFEQNISTGNGWNAALTICFFLPIPLPVVKLCANPGFNSSKSKSTDVIKVSDINGDGFPDILSAGNGGANTNDGELHVRLSKIGKTHLLKKVNTPTGGSWEVTYTRDGNTYEMPQSKYVLDSIKTNDAFTQDDTWSPGNTLTTIKYEKPHHDRREREFFGYEKVRVNQHDVLKGNSIYRHTKQEFHNNNYYLKGAVKRETLFDAENKIWTENITTYGIYDSETPVSYLPFGSNSSTYNLSLIDANKVRFNNSEINNVTFPTFIRTKLDHSRLFVSPLVSVKRFTEGNIGEDNKFAVSLMESFDTHGNVTQYRDYGEQNEDVYYTQIAYYNTISGVDNSTGFPKTIQVLDSNNTLLRKRGASYYPNTGELQKVGTSLNASETSIINMEYDEFGNMNKIIHNESINPEDNSPFFRNYTYDPVLHTYPTKVEDAFGYFSTSVYNYLFGIPVYTTDMNLQPMRTRIDDRGRPIEIAGPYELYIEGLTGAPNAWTLRFEYQDETPVATTVADATIDDDGYITLYNAKNNFIPTNSVTNLGENKPHHALTRHFDPEYRTGEAELTTTNQILTMTLADGFGKPVQVKKTTALFDGSASTGVDNTTADPTIDNELVWLLNGKIKTDAFGRAFQSYYPTTQDFIVNNTSEYTPTAPAYAYQDAEDTEAPPTISGDYDPLDRAHFTQLPGETEQTTLQYAIGGNRFITTITNELGQVQKSYADIRGRTTQTLQESVTGNIDTHFTFNPIGELMKVKDVAGNETLSFYDLAGRRTEVRHPDNGITKFTYDRASNLAKRETSNLLQQGKNEAVTYQYTYNRLDAIKYPQFPENNVRYYYGTAGNSDAANDNAVGRLWYHVDATGTQYFEYGKLGELIKNRRSIAVPNDKVYWFQTEWTYDTWNRVKAIKYPDEEVVTYKYNQGGELYAMLSEKAGSKNKNIISQLGYDKFGQRTYLRYGNGTETTYNYEADRRRLENMKVQSNTAFQAAQARTFIDNKYEYDIVSNVKAIYNNTIASPTTTQIGGKSWQQYTYDDLNRMVTASGNFVGRNEDHKGFTNQKYTLAMSYDSQHNILSKIQNHQTAISPTDSDVVKDWTDAEPTSYNLKYEGYNTADYKIAGYDYKQPHAPRKIIDQPSTVGCCGPAETDTRIKTKLFDYDANGNQVRIRQKICTSPLADTLRVNLWDEENRLRAVDLNPEAEGMHPIAIYTYDAGGERIIKQNAASIAIYENALKTADSLQTDFMIYPSGMLVARVGAKDSLSYTKHYFAGSQRVSSAIGTTKNVGGFLYEWTLQENSSGGSPMNPISTSHDQLKIAEGGLNHVFGEFHMPEQTYNTQAYFVPIPAFIHGEKETERYFFHPDHLGSSNYITNFDGNVNQHMEYFAFGETFVEEHLNSHNSPYKYNGKELDEETGNYYYGARYYDPRLSLWVSVDPLAEETMQPYGYVSNNPLRFVDLLGLAPDDWVERTDKEGNKSIVWEENVTSADDKDLKEGDRYLGKAVVVFEGSENEKLGKGDNLFGEGANLAKVTVYGPDGEDDIKEYGGYTMSSDPSKYGTVADGEYNVYYDKIGKSGALKSNWAVEGRRNVPARNGVNPAFPNRKPGYLNGVFMHRSNNSGYAGGGVSKGCPLICPSLNNPGNGWDEFNKQLKGVKQFKMILKRD